VYDVAEVHRCSKALVRYKEAHRSGLEERSKQREVTRFDLTMVVLLNFPKVFAD
jgi:hypothetical protein